MNLKQLIEDAVEAGTSTSDLAHADVKLNTKKPLKRKKQMDNTENITENENFKIYTDGNYTMFEILNEEDWLVYNQGLKKENPRIWRMNETTLSMAEAMNKYKATGFKVKFQNQITTPSLRFRAY